MAEDRRQPMRVSDVERAQTVDRLSEAHCVGRITLEEFEERMTTALSARTTADLAVLVEDLPVPTNMLRLRSLADELLETAAELGISRAELMAILISSGDDDAVRLSTRS